MTVTLPTSSVLINTLIKLMKMLAKKAVQNPDKTKPSTSDETSIRTSALSTSRNMPKVTTVSGRVRITSIGLTTALAKPRRSAEIARADAL